MIVESAKVSKGVNSIFVTRDRALIVYRDYCIITSSKCSRNDLVTERSNQRIEAIFPTGIRYLSSKARRKRTNTCVYLIIIPLKTIRGSKRFYSTILDDQLLHKIHNIEFFHFCQRFLTKKSIRLEFFFYQGSRKKLFSLLK